MYAYVVKNINMNPQTLFVSYNDDIDLKPLLVCWYLDHVSDLAHRGLICG